MKLIIYLSFFISFVSVIVSLTITNNMNEKPSMKQKPKSLSSNKKQFINAIIHENKDKQTGQFVSYKQSSTAFYDLRPIVDSFDSKQINLICVRGSWLLYDQPELAASSIGEVKLLSSEDKCAPPGISLGSIQPIGPLSPLYTDSITFFKGEFFSDEGVAVKQTMTPDKLKLMISQIDSFIVTGRSKWTIIVDFSQSICVSVKSNKLAPICFVPYLEDKPFSRIFEVRKGCELDDYNGFLTLEECANFGSGTIENIDVKHIPKILESSVGFVRPEGRGLGDYLATSSKMKGRSMAKGKGIEWDAEASSGSGCTSAAENPNSEGEKRCTDMLNMRMNQAIDIMEKDQNFMLPTDSANMWKTELLDETINVALASCPFEVAVPEYVKFAKELFLYLLNEIWEKEKASPPPADNIIEENEWKLLLAQTKMCSESVKRYGTRFQENVMAMYTLQRSAGDMSATDIPSLKLNRDKDTVIEYIWLIGNHVASTCHHASDYVDDYLEKYTRIFHQIYLIPMIDLWNNPGNTLSRCYNHILGGYDMDSQYQRMRLCTEQSLSLINNLQPWEKSWMNKTMWARK